ncbi:hypothetical protein CSB37_01255 [bacterium DOLZORAL124_38_8]|nr:MAG: hypothetical protein CSB37_01255 [bacterium DOLZORAL124_38_8]
MKHLSPLGFWERFYQIVCPQFLQRLLAEKTMSGKSWGFWFVSNTILTLILVVGMILGGQYLIKQAPEKIESALAEETISINGQNTTALEFIKNAKLTLANGELSVENIPDPMVVSTPKNKTTDKQTPAVISSQIIPENQTFFVLDTNNTFNLKMETFQQLAPKGGILIQKKRAFAWDQKKNRVQAFEFADINQKADEPIVLNWQKLTENRTILLPVISALAFSFGIVLWLFIAIGRLLNVLFWTLVFWGVTSFFKIKHLGFEKVFEALLHFGAITFPLAFVGLFAFGSHFFWNLIILGCLFGMNIWYIKNSKTNQ